MISYSPIETRCLYKTGKMVAGQLSQRDWGFGWEASLHLHYRLALQVFEASNWLWYRPETSSTYQPHNM